MSDASRSRDRARRLSLKLQHEDSDQGGDGFCGTGLAESQSPLLRASGPIRQRLAAFRTARPSAFRRDLRDALQDACVHACL